MFICPTIRGRHAGNTMTMKGGSFVDSSDAEPASPCAKSPTPHQYRSAFTMNVCTSTKKSMLQSL